MTTPSPHAETAAKASVLGRLWKGTFWLALKSPLQVVIAFWSIPLIQHAIGVEANGAYVFAWGFGFVQFLLEFGMVSALQRQVTQAWTRNDRDGVNRLIASGMIFFTAVALVQVVILLAVAYVGLPAKFEGESRRLIVGLLWLQALTAPLFGLLNVTSSVLQAARRYELMPKMDLVVTVSRFVVLVAGLHAGVDFLIIVALQLAVQLGGILAPALWVMVRELGFVPHFSGARRGDFAGLFRVAFYLFLMQLSVAMADKVDTTILGYALPQSDAGQGITVYQNVSKPFLQIRQTGWTLAYLVMPAVASLAAAHDLAGLERIKYDGPRLLIGSLLPVVLLAWLYAAPFLAAWVGPQYVPYAPLLRLFLVAALPLVLSVYSQMAIGLGKYEVVSLSPLAGSLVNLPLSYYLTTRLGVAGVIWGTVLTTLISNLLVPGVYLFRLLEVRPAAFFMRTMLAPAAGAALLLATARACRLVAPLASAGPVWKTGAVPLAAQLAVCSAAYAAGYLSVPAGRADLAAVWRQLRARSPASRS